RLLPVAGVQPWLWSREDVLHWLRWAQQEYALRQADPSRFRMNGRALCMLTKDDFRHRAPGSGDVLYEVLQYIRIQRRALVCSPLLSSPLREGRTSAGGLWKTSWGLPSYTTGLVCWVSPAGPGCSAEAAPAAAFSCLDRAEQLLSRGHLEPLSLSHGSPESSCRTDAICSSPTTLPAPVDGKIADCRLLWDYVYQLLSDSHYEAYIKWEDREAKVFRVVNPNGLAQLWGNHKNRLNMTYEKMSRALRHYYKLNIIRKEPGQKLLFRFLKTPGEIIQEKSSKLEQLENEDHDDLREEPLEVSL
ncbi:ETV7 factor, partial [Semnornis frantzii]|nr:ETV7 factor [Semnornis frantzii]